MGHRLKWLQINISNTGEKLFFLKNSFYSQDIQILVILSLPFHTFQIQKDIKKPNNLWFHELACIN